MIQNFRQKSHFLRNIHIAYNQAQTMLVAFMVARNGFLTKFHIEIVIQLFSQLLFFSLKKIILIWKTFRLENSIFEKILKMFENFPKLFFSTKKIKLRKKLDHYFDVKFCQEFISGNHKCNQHCLSLILQRNEDFAASDVFTSRFWLIHRISLTSFRSRLRCLST